MLSKKQVIMMTTGREAIFLDHIHVTDTLSITTYSLNIEGYKVTLGVGLNDEEHDDGVNTISGKVKVAICSPEDRYKEEVGVSLVMGRLINSDTSDFDIATSGKFGPEAVLTMSEVILESWIDDLAIALRKKNRLLELQKRQQHLIVKNLKHIMEDFTE